MKKQKILLSACLLAFTVLLVGATLLYNSLSEQNMTDNLMAVNTTTAAPEGGSAPADQPGQLLRYNRRTSLKSPRHCEERSDVAISRYRVTNSQAVAEDSHGLTPSEWPW